jgi:glutamate N-acetyltransferase/amino-acid N-acetyltransferase
MNEVPGFLAGAVAAGIKKQDRKDLAVIFSQVPACAAGMFTTNRVQAAPVILDKERLTSGRAQAIIANSGNANACTGSAGMDAARRVADHAASALGLEAELVLVASTGVIGQPLPVSVITEALPQASGALAPAGFPQVAEAIMTTDTRPKIASRTGRVDGRTFTVTGVAKGAGMIRPDMATMLCFVCTDLGATPDLLRDSLRRAVEQSFNAITIDGDTSTNDTVLLLANGMSGLDIGRPSCGAVFQEALDDLLVSLAWEIVGDGEGATKSVAITVKGAKTEAAAKQVGYVVADSLLVKTAFFGEDANWGRIMAAVGRAGVSINPETIDVLFDDVLLVSGGGYAGPDAEAAATQVLKKPTFVVTIDLKKGSRSATVYTCDLSTDYVKINADYRS